MLKAVYLPVNETLPRQIELAVKLESLPEEGEFESVHAAVKEYTGPNSALQHIHIERDGMDGPSLPGYLLDMVVRDTFGIDGSAINQCVQHITQGQTKYDWNGPIVITREEMKKSYWAPEGKLEDLELEDIGPVIKYLQQYEF